jgi:threonine/homoserine/homoserine lactone efflux protein
MTLELFVAVVAVSTSGVLSPGPLSIASIMRGISGGWRAGVALAVGHTLVEFPLIMGLAYGLFNITQNPMVDRVIALLGGVFLMVFAVIHFCSLTHRVQLHRDDVRISLRSSITIGILLTGLNPFFITWWLTVGSRLILDAVIQLSLLGAVFVFLSHIWMDYVWLTFLSHASSRARSFLGSKAHRGLLLVFALIMLYYGVVFLQRGLF